MLQGRYRLFPQILTHFTFQSVMLWDSHHSTNFYISITFKRSRIKNSTQFVNPHVTQHPLGA